MSSKTIHENGGSVNPPGGDERSAQADGFLKNLFGSAENGYVSLWRLDTKESCHVALPGGLAVGAKVVAWSEETDVFCGVGLRGRDLGRERRGSSEDVVCIPGIWFDLDVVTPMRKKPLPLSIGEALAFIDELEHPPSIVVASGGGLQPWWVFREVWLLDSPRERAKAAAIVGAWQRHVIARGKAKGWLLDYTGDLSRLARLPGTLNRKYDPPALVAVLRELDVRYNPGDFEGFQDEDPPGRKSAPPVRDGITEGSRNSVLTSLGGSMRRRGMSDAGIFAALLAENQARCRPPLGEEEVRRIAASVCRYEPGDRAHEAGEKAELLPSIRDFAHAEALSVLFRDRFRWAIHRAGWMTWTGKVWQPVPEQVVATQATGELRRCYAERIAGSSTGEEAEHWAKLAGETCVYPRIQGGLNFLKGWPGFTTRVEEWDPDPWALNVENGVLDLRSGTLRPHCPSGLFTKLAQVNYDPTATGPRWQAHLARVLPNPNIRRHVQRSLGRSLAGAVLVERLDLWHGEGANGKTTTARVIRSVLNDYSCRAAPNLLVETKSDRHPTEIADLHGNRLVFSEEIDEAKRLAEGLLKDLTGGGRKKARFMRADFFEFDQTFDIVLIVNHKPIITGTDNAVWRRIKLVPWLVGIPEDEQRPQDEVVSELAAEGSAILNWLLEGLADWQADHGWCAPEVEAATNEYRASMDSLGGFLAALCETGPRYQAAAVELYDAYAGWCDQNAEIAVNKTRFGKLLGSRGLVKGRLPGSGARVWRGVRLKPPNASQRQCGENPEEDAGVTRRDTFAYYDAKMRSHRGNIDNASQRVTIQSQTAKHTETQSGSDVSPGGDTPSPQLDPLLGYEAPDEAASVGGQVDPAPPDTPPFAPSSEWQVVPKGCTVPMYGQYRMEMDTGLWFVRWPYLAETCGTCAHRAGQRCALARPARAVLPGSPACERHRPEDGARSQEEA